MSLQTRLAGLEARLAADGLDSWLPTVPTAAAAAIAPGRHGDLPRWETALDRLPTAVPGRVRLATDVVTVGTSAELDAPRRARLQAALAALQPWRKGPFSLFGVDVDAEWRSEMKWRRVLAAALPLAGSRILDVGCGNGYYAWRMRGAGARRVIGVDPGLVHVHQFAAVQHYLADDAVDVLPLGAEALPTGTGAFDLVFSMGVLYHRRSPLDHLRDLVAHLAPGGHLVVETLVVTGDAERVLCPPGRYARMRNVWFLPSAALAVRWLERLGLEAVEVVDETPTTTAEQRSTDWMPFQSLAESLDPADPARTIEGHPGPRRALIVGRRGRGGDDGP